MFDWLVSPTINRTVERGIVHCPVRHRDYDVERCMTCPFLADVDSDASGEVTSIVCTPSYRALVGSDLD